MLKQKQKMERKTILLPREMVDWYKEEANKKEISLSDIIRITLRKNISTRRKND